MQNLSLLFYANKAGGVFKKMVASIENGTKEKIEYSILFIFIVLYIWNITHYFWTFSIPNDPLQYLGPAYWGTTYGCWPWLDRINLAVNLRIFIKIFTNPYLAGMIYIGFVNTLILLISIIWVYRKSGFWASLIIGILFNTSYMTLGWATYLYPDQTVALYSLLAFISFFSNRQAKYFSPTLIAGLFIGFALLTKITAVATLVFFLIYCVYHKQWLDIKKLIIGIAIATFFVITLFCLLYNYQSLKDMFIQFFTTNLTNNLFIPHKMAQNYSNLLLSIMYFPFIALFITVGAYKKGITKHLFCFAWVFIILLNILRPIGPPIPSYIYSAYIFVCLGLAIYLSKNMEKEHILNNKYKIGITACSIILIICGFNIGFQYPAINAFSDVYSYLDKLDIYKDWTSFGLKYPLFVPVLFSLIPGLMVGILAWTEFSKSRIITTLLILTIAFGGSFYNGGMAYQKTYFERNYTNECYAFASLLTEVPSTKFGIYINPSAYSGERIQLDLWLYSYLFSKNISDDAFDSLIKHNKLITNSIKIISNEIQLSEFNDEFILTDSPNTVIKIFPNAKSIKEMDLTNEFMKFDYVQNRKAKEYQLPISKMYLLEIN